MSENEMNVSTPTYEAEIVETKKKTGKKGILIGVAVLAAVVVIAAIVIGMLGNTPWSLLATGFQNSMKALEGNSYRDMMEEVSNGGSMELTMDLASLLQESGLPMEGTGSLKFYMNEKEEKSAMTLGVQLGRQTLDASMFANGESVVIASDWLLGKEAYGIELKSFVEDYEKSVFGPNGAYSLGLEIPENFQEQLDKRAAYQEATAKLIIQMVTRLMTSVEKNSVVSQENATVSLGGQEVNTTAVVLKMDHMQLAAVLSDMVEYLRTDEAIRTYLEEYKDIVAVSAADGTLGAEDMVEEFYKMLDEAAEKMDEKRSELEEEAAGLVATFHITKSGKQLIGMELLLESNVKPGKVSVYAGPDLKDAKEISFSVDNGDEVIQGTYEIKANDKKQYDAQLKILADSKTMFSSQITWNKENGDFAVTATNSQESTVVLRGTLQQTKEELKFVLDSGEADGQKTDLGIGILLRTSDKMPEMPEYKSVLAMTEDEVTSIVNDLGMLILQLAYGIG